MDDNGRLPSSFENLQLVTDPDEWANRLEQVHGRQMRIYEDKFENNKIMYFHDVWEYAERRLADPDGAVQINHPCDPEQHASVPGQGVPSHGGASSQPHNYIKQANELDQMNNFSDELQRLRDDDYTPQWVKD